MIREKIATVYCQRPLKSPKMTYSNHDGIPMTSNLSYLLSWLFFLGGGAGKSKSNFSNNFWTTFKAKWPLSPPC